MQTYRREESRRRFVTRLEKARRATTPADGSFKKYSQAEASAFQRVVTTAARLTGRKRTVKQDQASTEDSMQRSFEQHSIEVEVREEGIAKRRRDREARRQSMRDFYDAQRKAKKAEADSERAVMKEQYEREMAARRAEEQAKQQRFQAARGARLQKRREASARRP